MLHKEAKAKGNAQFVEKLTFCTFDGFQTKPLWKLVILEKLLLLKVFFTLLIKHTITFFVIVLFNIFMRQTLTDDVWGYTKM